jgi:RNA polymerase sigma-70 factor (ECF subfamily)
MADQTGSPRSGREGLSDAALIAASLDNGDAFETIFDRYYSRIFGFLVNRVGPSAAEDLASEVFTIAFKQRSTFRPDVPIAGPWLFGIAANLARRHFRSNARRARALGRVAPSAVWFDPDLEAQIDARQRVGELTKVLGRLREQDREVLLLYAVADLSYEEISQALSIPVGTVRSRLSRTRTRMRNLLPPEGQSPKEGHGTPGGGE